MKSSSRVSGASALTLLVGVAALTTVSVPGQSLFREVTLIDLLTGATPVDLSSLAYTGGLFFVGLGVTVIGLVLLIARVS